MVPKSIDIMGRPRHKDQTSTNMLFWLCMHKSEQIKIIKGLNIKYLDTALDAI